MKARWYLKKTGERFAKVKIEGRVTYDVIEKTAAYYADVYGTDARQLRSKAALVEAIKDTLTWRGSDFFVYFWENYNIPEEVIEHAKTVARKFFPDFYEKVEV